MNGSKFRFWNSEKIALNINAERKRFSNSEKKMHEVNVKLDRHQRDTEA